MKEFRELQKSQNDRSEKIFSVNLTTWKFRAEICIKIKFSHRAQIFCLFRHSIHTKFSLQAELINDNLFEWHVRLFHLDPESPLAQDMEEFNVPSILLHLIFPDNFPFAPPFMRVVEPRIEKGFVMEGGAICMELLTPRGSFQWIFNPICDAENWHKKPIFFLPLRLGIGVHYRSHSHAVCCQLSQRSGQDLSEDESQ